MGLTCDILDCQQQYDPGTSLHRIPAAAVARNAWIKFIRNSRDDQDWKPSINNALCSHHFESKWFPEGQNPLRRRILKNAVPTILGGKFKSDGNATCSVDLTTDEIAQPESRFGSITFVRSAVDENILHVAAIMLYRLAKLTRPLWISIGIDDDSYDTIFHSQSQPDSRNNESKILETPSGSPTKGVKRKLEMSNVEPVATPRRVKLDHSYTCKTTPKTTTRNLKSALKTVKRKLHVSKIKALRKEKRVLSMRVLIKRMKQTLGEEKATTISSSYSSVLKSLIRTENQKQKVKRPCGLRYSETMKKFAVTLHFYSPRAYKFLKDHITLPHESTLAAWMSSTDCGPGFNIEIIKTLGDARRKAINHCMDDIVLQLDEMAIKKETLWDPKNHRFVGTIDYGPGCELVDPPLASNALVILVAGISGGWKVPIGYIFTNKVNGTVEYNLVSKAIQLMSEQAFTVHAVVGDGCSSNVSMFKAFGIVENPKSIQFTFNSLPGVNEKIHAIFDVVHMMKLWRNMLHQYKVIFWRESAVKWLYFEYLEQLQDHELIRAANRLSPQHIHFENNRMKVKLAVQIFSSSVADAIDFCREDLNLHQFQGSEATTRFIRLLDKTFDILNSRHPMQRGYKQPLTLSNFTDRKEFLLTMCDELQHLSTGPRKSKKFGKPDLPSVPIWKCQRKRAVIGLIVSSNSIIQIAQRILFRTENPLKFVLTYRFCQDLIELLFNKIRGRLGANNNPNVLEFENIMKKIWHQNLLKSTSTGNCIIQMEETDIPGGLLPLQRPRKIQNIVVDYETEASNYLDMPNIVEEEYTLFYYNCLAYISGNVVKSIQPRMSCEACVSGLFDTAFDPLPENVKKLITRKDLGGLIYSSLSVYRIVAVADKSFRKFISFGNALSVQSLDFKIARDVLVHFRDMDLFPTLSTHFLHFELLTLKITKQRL